MTAHLTEWLHLIVKFIHVITAILWIGSSFFFMWLDSNLEAPGEEKKDDVEGKLWMVHSGGFYLVEKKLIKPGGMPEILHWFKWEATFTWISGFFLLGIVYYMGGAVYTIKPGSGLSPTTAMITGISVLFFGWIIYDLMWHYLFRNRMKLGSIISFAMLIGVAYGLSHIFSGRGMFIHVGALLGTLMMVNVWVRILPAQSQMIAATEKGEIPDYGLGKAAKQRSIHNNYMTFPVIIIMISNHIPSTYGHPVAWLVLAGLALCGAGIKHYMNVSTPISKAALVASIAGLVGLFMYTAPAGTVFAHKHDHNTHQEVVAFQDAYDVVQKHCLSCHSSAPTDEIFKVAPLGAIFETPEQIQAYAQKIKARSVDSHTMPLGNKTGMTLEERQILGAWIAQGAKTK